MRTTPAILAAEAAAGSWFTDPHRWRTWSVVGNQRHPAQATLLALHLPTTQLLAVHVRPRQLHPSERPNLDTYPPDVVHVIWTPRSMPEVRRWLSLPAYDPPGLLAGTWRTP